MDLLQSMRVFCRVAERGQFASAARDLDLSPAAVTRLVAALEAHLDARLISRTTRRFELTEVGRAYRQRALAILQALDETEAQVAREGRDLRGHIRLLAPAAFTVHQFAKLLPRFRELCPEVTVEVTACGPLDTLDEGHDLCILAEGRQPIEGGFVARRLACSELVLCASPGYLDRSGCPQHPRDLGRQGVMLPSHLRGLTFHGAGQTWDWQARRPAIGAGDSNTLHVGALHGAGIAALPSFMVQDALRCGALQRVLPGWRLMRYTLHAAMPTRRHVPARTRAMVDFLVDQLGGTEHDPWLAAIERDEAASPGDRQAIRRPVASSCPGA